MNDLQLLQTYEPVILFTEGELFFPCAVDSYLQHCSLWLVDVDRRATQLATPSELTVETLAQHDDIPTDQRLYLQFVAEPLDALAYQRWRTRPDRPHFRNPNRLERVGLAGRIVDGLFDVALLARGRVPGGTVAVAQTQYQQIRQDDNRFVYYARVLRPAGYIVLHYIYFYVMNDWRSSFHGVNDHESDWEQVFVYLSQEEIGEPKPRWVAYASHDFSGDDLRRRWDDPELQRVDDTHPIIYAGAGSHASYFTAGEYVTQIEPADIKRLHQLGDALDKFWTRSLGQSGSLGLTRGLKSLTSIPFIDYARGDGTRVGQGQQHSWTPLLISGDDGWVSRYRGLWGLDTWDPLGGERAPGGPKYDRDGTVRLSWRDPLGWAGLDKVLPPNQAIKELKSLLIRFAKEESELIQQIEQQQNKVRILEIECEALRADAYYGHLLSRRTAALDVEMDTLHDLKQQQADLAETRKASAENLAQLATGNLGSPRAHIRHAHTPQSTSEKYHSRFARLWAAVSGGLLLFLMVGVAYWQPPEWPVWLVAIAITFGAIEAATQGILVTYLLNVTIFLAIVTAAILLYSFWWLALILAFAALVILMIRDNLREISFE